VRRKREAGGAANLASASRYPEQPAPHPGKRETAAEPSAFRRHRVFSLGNGVTLVRPDLSPPVVDERYAYYCKPCDHEADSRYTDKYGVLEWLTGSSPVDRCPKGGACLRLTCEWLSAELGFDVNAGDLKHDPRPFLLALDQNIPMYSSATGGRFAPPRVESPRSDEEWARCVRDLRRFRAGATARAYLRERGVDPRQHDLGLTLRRGYDAIVARCYCGGKVVSEAFRSIDPRGRKNDLLRDCPAGFINGVPPGWKIILVAGFTDLFSARQNGLPAASAIGTNLPDHLLPDLDGKSVAIAYDVGEEDAAERTAAKLSARGTRAHIVELGRLGLPLKGDLTDYFVRGGSAMELREHIKRECRRAS
jgi:hypothetical protein